MTIPTNLWSLLLLAGTVGSAQTLGNASGTLTVNGKATKIITAQALEIQDWTYDSKARKFVAVKAVKVSLSDVPVEDLEDNFEKFLRGREGKLHAIVLTFNTKGKATDGELIHETFTNGAISFSGSDVARFERKTLDNKTISGKVSVGKLQEFNGVTYEFSVAFNAAIQPQPKPTVEGPEAETTGAGKAVWEFLRAAASRDTTALKRIFRPEIAKLLEDPDRNQEVWGLLDYSYPVDKVYKIVRIFDFGNRAWVEAMSTRPSESGGPPVDVTTRVRLVRVNGEWKVQPM